MIQYENSAGEVIRLDQNGYYCDEGDLRGFAWDYTYSAYPDGTGGSVSMFYRHEKTKSFTVSAHAYSRTEINALLNRLHNVTEYDVRQRSPGKLWLDNQYVTCYIVVSEIANKSKHMLFVTKKLTILPVIPYWCIEKTKTFFKNDSSSTVTDGKKYNGRYAYKYGTGYAQTSLDNSEVAWDTPMIITVYGPAVNPSLTVGGHTYTVNATITAAERLVIDQLRKKIYKIGSAGTTTNLFNARDKTVDIFQFAPSGSVSVLHNGDFSFEITLIQQRSEPLWTN